jgi:hypothetical protein
MLEIMVPVESVRSPGTKYTAQGLGDRLHLITLGWVLSEKLKGSVRLHLSRDHWLGKKRESFHEILELFPTRNIELIFHGYSAQDNQDFRRYLLSINIGPQDFFYGDFPGWNESRVGIDVSKYLSPIPLLQRPIESGVSSYITCQWDSTGSQRKLSEDEISKIVDGYKRDGFSVITVGGSALERKYRDSLSSIAKLISGAEFHIGVDSGFMHLAQLYLPPERIHVYSKFGRYWSHHLFRGLKNGIILNAKGKKMSWFELRYAELRYNSPRLMKFKHSISSKG